MPSGGKRDGAGSKPGVRRASIQRRLVSERGNKLMPAAALLYKMDWWLNRVGEQQRHRVALGAQASPEQLALIDKEIERCLDKVEEAAAKAAPFYHSRLAAMTIQGEITNRLDLTKCTAKELDFLERIFRKSGLAEISDEPGRDPGREGETAH